MHRTGMCVTTVALASATAYKNNRTANQVSWNEISKGCCRIHEGRSIRNQRSGQDINTSDSSTANGISHSQKQCTKAGFLEWLFNFLVFNDSGK